jgi:hypothetical protein
MHRVFRREEETWRQGIDDPNVARMVSPARRGDPKWVPLNGLPKLNA